MSWVDDRCRCSPFARESRLDALGNPVRLKSPDSGEGWTFTMQHMPSLARTLWLTGLSGAGKSTLARLTIQALRMRGMTSLLLDGDQLRAGICADLGFSAAARQENIRRAAAIAALANAQGIQVVAALISPLRADRELAGRLIGAPAFLEVHVSTALAVCERRDPKGLYRRARSGELADFTGVSAPYEEPLTPCLRIDTAMRTPAECVIDLLGLLEPQ